MLDTHTVDFFDVDTRLAAYGLVVDPVDGVLLAWFNGSQPQWTLPGGGVEYGESLEEAVVREVREEAGYDVTVGRPLTTHLFSRADGPRPPRPFRSVRVVFEVSVVGGELGTLEVGGTTDYAQWIALDQLDELQPRAEIVGVALSAWRRYR